MEIAHKKSVQKHASLIIFIGLLVGLGVGLSLQLKPDFSSRALGALFDSKMQIVPAKNGLATVHNTNESSGVGDMSEAGSRFNSQMNLMSQ